MMRKTVLKTEATFPEGYGDGGEASSRTSNLREH